jgi:hypothetical protein
MRARRFPLACLVALAACLAPASAVGKDICLDDTQGATWWFQKVKKFKVGRAVPLHGIYISGNLMPETFPVQGVAVLRPDGNVEVGAFVHSMSASLFTGADFTASMQVTTGLEGTGGLDTDGNGTVNVASYGWAAVDCGAVTVP